MEQWDVDGGMAGWRIGRMGDKPFQRNYPDGPEGT
jgi:hypothetical protein